MAEERVQRRLAAILAADVVGYGHLIGADEAGTRSRVNDQLDDIVRPAIDEHRGRLVKTMGDGFLIEFGSVVDAVQCATDIQNGVATQQRSEPVDRKLLLRIGVHLGDVIVEGDDIHGDGVNIAARLEGLAEPGGICVSDMVRAGVRNKLAVEFDDLGDQSLKNVADPVQVFRVGRQEAIVGDGSRPGANFRRPAIAVLPFDNMSGDPEQEYFSDGLTEEIITALCRWRRFPVIARNSTFTYKGHSTNIQKVGEELSARYVVEGSVRKAHNRVRVTAQLINSETGHHIWAERYDREISDVFALQDEIAQQIAAIIEPTIERSERLRISTTPPSNIGAWEYSLRGFSCIYEGTKEANDRAIEMFNRAIELDPNFARAHSGLSYAYIKDIRFFRSIDREECKRLVSEISRRAVALDETDPEARTMLARAYIFEGQPEAAIAEARRAVEFSPFDAFANNMLGAALSMASGFYDEGIPWFEKALQLNPLDPQSHLYLTHLALANLGAERYEDAAEHAREAIRLKPDFLEAQIALASSLGHLNHSAEGAKAIEEIRDVAMHYVETHVAYAQDLKDRVIDGLRKAGLPE